VISFNFGTAATARKSITLIILGIILLTGTITSFYHPSAFSSSSFLKNAQAQSVNKSLEDINCDNINLNVNDIYIDTLPKSLVDLAGLVQQTGEPGLGSGEQSSRINDFIYKCLNNNNNELGLSELPSPISPTPPLVDTETLTVIKTAECQLDQEICEQIQFQPSQFNLTIEGNNPSQTSFPGSSEGTDIQLGPGTYSVSEEGLDPVTPEICSDLGYGGGKEASDIVENSFICTDFSPECQGDLSIGNPKTCTIDNILLQQSVCESNGYVVWEDNTPGNFDIFISRCTDGEAFGLPENISTNEGDSLLPKIAVNGNNVYVIWRDNTFGDFDIYVAVSTDGGLNFGTPEIISNSLGESDQQQIAVFGDNVYVVWVEDNDTFIAVSTDGGQNFGTPQNLSNSLGESLNPQIAVAGDNVYVVWQDEISAGNNDIFIAVSTDGGQNFGTPQNLSNSLGESLNPQIAVAGDNVYVVWQEGANNPDILITLSTDNGGSFVTPVPVTNSTGSSENPQIAVSENKVHIVWQESASNPDIYLSSFNPGTLNLPIPEDISNTPESSTKPKIDTSEDNLIVVWNEIAPTGTLILGRISTDEGETLSEVEDTLPNLDEAFEPLENIMDIDWSGVFGNPFVAAPVASKNDTSVPKFIFTNIGFGGSGKFGTPQKINNIERDANTPQIAISGNNVYVVMWGDDALGNRNIFIARSTDGGQTFDVPKKIGSGSNNIFQQIAVSGNNVYVVWGGNDPDDIFIVRSTDGGQTFSTPENISNMAGVSDRPQIAVSGDNVYVVWVEDNTDTFIAVSTDGGQNFGTPENLSNTTEFTFEPHIAVSGNNVYVIWSQLIESGDSDVFISISTDGGQNFGTPQNLSNSAQQVTNRLQITVAGNNIYVVWEEDGIVSPGTFIAISTDSGQTFNTDKLSSNAQTDNPQVAVSGNNVYVVWDQLEGTDFDIFIARSTDGGQTFSTAENLSDNIGNSFSPQIAISGSNVYVVWQDDGNDNGQTLFSRSTDDGQTFNTPANLSNTDAFSLLQQLAVSANNVYVVWEETIFTGNNQVFISVSTEDGETFNAPREITKIGAIANKPQIASS
jgi:hypothetical protein